MVLALDGWRAKARCTVNLPNIITILRLLLVPLIVFLMLKDLMGAAFMVFLVAGISDAVDGLLAKRLDQVTNLGTYLDPIADKVLLVSIYVTLGVGDYLPVWLVLKGSSSAGAWAGSAGAEFSPAAAGFFSSMGLALISRLIGLSNGSRST